MKNPTYTCPRCGSAATKRCETLYEQSLNEGPGYTTQRAFAARASPPTGGSWVPEMMCFVGAFLALGTWTWVVSFGLVVVGVLLARKRIREMGSHANNMALYRMLWICTDCGHVYKPTSVEMVVSAEPTP